MLSLIVILIFCLFTEFGYTVFLELEREEDRCDAIMKEIVSESKTTITDNTPSRLHSTWLSQECEIRAGPEYVIRKYSFFENGTFYLLRYHYAEESCSIATYTVVARGSIELSSPSITIPGASEANVEIDSIHVIPLTRQVARKCGRRINAICGGDIEVKWRPYVPQLIYERAFDASSNSSFHVHGLNSNSLKSRLTRRPRKSGTLNCLESFGIEFTELRLIRVEKKRSVSDFATDWSNRERTGTEKSRIRVELLLGGLTRKGGSQRSDSVEKPNRLQSAALLRADTAAHCPICRSVFRATEYSPPLFHQTPPLPAVIGGLWLSIRCESIDGGFWSRRFFRIYSSGSQWSARWTYYADSTCSILLHTVITAGTYVQRVVRRKRDAAIRNDDRTNATTFNDVRIHFQREEKHSETESNVYRTMLQDMDKKESTIGIDRITFFSARKDVALLSGTTELELRVAESHSIPVDKKTMLSLCGQTAEKGKRRTKTEASSILISWSKNCAPRVVEAPAILRFKARISLDWNGDYTLLLASWNDDLWEAPLRRCSETAWRSFLQEKNVLENVFISSREQDSRFNRRGRYRFSLSSASCLSTNRSFLTCTVISLLFTLLVEKSTSATKLFEFER